MIPSELSDEKNPRERKGYPGPKVSRADSERSEYLIWALVKEKGAHPDRGEKDKRQEFHCLRQRADEVIE